MIETVHRVIADYQEVLDRCVEGSLLHGDLGSIHVWVDPESETITSLVDFGERASGDPMWDIVEYDWEGRQSLLEGYGWGGWGREDEVTFYLYAMLRAVPWAQKWHSRGETQTIDWLKFVIQRARSRLVDGSSSLSLVEEGV